MAKLRKHDYTLDGSDWDLSTLSLSDAPVDELKLNPKAKRVDLSNNRLTRLPPSFATLTHLVVLDISQNKLNELPENFGDLMRLTRLDLYSNQLESLPLSFGRLGRLKWLDLKNNPLDAGLARVAGDCANARQCELCAKNVIQYMVSEEHRVRKEDNERAEKLRQRQEIENKLLEKNRIQKEKKKAKVARRSARKARKSSEDNLEDDSPPIDADCDDYTDNVKSKPNILIYLLILIRILGVVFLMSALIYIIIAFALHLQNGLKLESFSDITIALQNSFDLLDDRQKLFKELSLLFNKCINNISNWRQLFNIYVDERTKR